MTGTQEIICLSSDEEDLKEDVLTEEVIEVKPEVNETKAEIITLSESEEEEEEDRFADLDDLDPNETRTKLFVNYLPQGLTDDEFNTIFMEVGPIKESFIFRHRHTDYSYGYGIIEYEYPEDAAKAIKTRNNYQIQEKSLKVRYSRERNGGYSNLFFQEAGAEANEQTITKVFEPFGEVIQFKLIKDENGQSLGRGFVRFGNRFQARMAVQELDQIKTLDGSNRPLSVKFAEEHGKKKAQIYAVASIRKAKNWKNRRNGGIYNRLGYTQKRRYNIGGGGIKSRLGHRQMKRLN